MELRIISVLINRLSGPFMWLNLKNQITCRKPAIQAIYTIIDPGIQLQSHDTQFPWTLFPYSSEAPGNHFIHSLTNARAWDPIMVAISSNCCIQWHLRDKLDINRLPVCFTRVWSITWPAHRLYMSRHKMKTRPYIAFVCLSPDHHPPWAHQHNLLFARCLLVLLYEAISYGWVGPMF